MCRFAQSNMLDSPYGKNQMDNVFTMKLIYFSKNLFFFFFFFTINEYMNDV